MQSSLKQKDLFRATSERRLNFVGAESFIQSHTREKAICFWSRKFYLEPTPQRRLTVFRAERFIQTPHQRES
jgi:hypothetical protein